MLVSVIIPTFNEARFIGQTLDAVARMRGVVEVIVVDGGSVDETVAVVGGRRDVKLINAERGRGAQMHAGAGVAQGKVLWFLHADTIPQPDAFELIGESLGDPHVVGGNFNIHFDGHRIAARFLTCFYRQMRRLGLYYGDSAIFVRREIYEHIGGFKPFPIFEDLDLVRRLNKCGRMTHLTSSVVTSSRRFEGRSFLRTFSQWMFLQLLYWMGASPHTLGTLYTPVRSAMKSRTH